MALSAITPRRNSSFRARRSSRFVEADTLALVACTFTAASDRFSVLATFAKDHPAKKRATSFSRSGSVHFRLGLRVMIGTFDTGAL